MFWIQTFVKSLFLCNEPRHNLVRGTRTGARVGQLLLCTMTLVYSSSTGALRLWLGRVSVSLLQLHHVLSSSGSFSGFYEYQVALNRFGNEAGVFLD